MFTGSACHYLRIAGLSFLWMTKTLDAVDSKHLSYLMRIKALKANWNDTKNSWTGWLKQNKTNWWKQKSKSGWADLHHDNRSRDDNEGDWCKYIATFYNTDYFALWIFLACRQNTKFMDQNLSARIAILKLKLHLTYENLRCCRHVTRTSLGDSA